MNWNTPGPQITGNIRSFNNPLPTRTTQLKDTCSHSWVAFLSLNNSWRSKFLADLPLMRPGIGLAHNRGRERESTQSYKITNMLSTASCLKVKVLWPLIRILSQGCELWLLIRKFILSRFHHGKNSLVNNPKIITSVYKSLLTPSSSPLTTQLRELVIISFTVEF